MSTHQPKAGLCMACVKLRHDCSGLPFATMPVLHTYDDGVKVVKCTSYERPKVNELGSALTKSNVK